MDTLAEGQFYADRLAEVVRSGGSEDLQAMLSRWTPGDLLIVGVVMARVALGREHYGGWDPAEEQRDMECEQLEELADRLVYSAMAVQLRAATMRRAGVGRRLAVVPADGGVA